MNTTYIILTIFGVVVLWFIIAYNGFIRLITRAKEAWADIEVQLKRRYDLIPNLVETVKGYASHEKGVFERVTQLRVQAMGAQEINKKGEAENMLTGALKTLFAVSENYPQLRANENFLELQKELADTENKIQASRRFYNTNVRDLNIKTDSFPSNLIAKIFNFSKMEFFQLEEEAAKEPVKVNF